MAKTLEEYENDPDIAHIDPEIRYRYAIKLKIYDETKDMTSNELKAYYAEAAEWGEKVSSGQLTLDLG